MHFPRNEFVLEIDWKKGNPTRVWIHANIDAYQDNYADDILGNHGGQRIGKCKVLCSELSSGIYTSGSLCNKEIPIYSTQSVKQLDIIEPIEINVGYPVKQPNINNPLKLRFRDYLYYVSQLLIPPQPHQPTKETKLVLGISNRSLSFSLSDS